MSPEITMALAGNPNAGKTTLFNAITGARQHVGNYPGVTVEKKEGFYELQGQRLKIVDLPGTYSLTAYSVEEVVARDYLVKEKPRVVVNIVDAVNLERNLYLTCQFFEMGLPMVIALNMVDVAKDRGITIDAARLSELLGVPVVPIVARTGHGVETLMQTALETALSGRVRKAEAISYGEDVDGALLQMDETITAAAFLTDLYPSRWLGIKLLEGDQQIIDQGQQTVYLPVSPVDEVFLLFAEGTGKGISAASRIDDLEALHRICAELLRRFEQPVLVEEFLPGREFTVGVLGSGRAARSVAVMEVNFRKNDAIYSYENKENYLERVTYTLLTEPALAGQVAGVALDAWRGLGCRDGGRVDIRLDDRGLPMFMEVNPLAGLNPIDSDLPIMCRLIGWPYEELIGEIVRSAVARIEHARRRPA